MSKFIDPYAPMGEVPNRAEESDAGSSVHASNGVPKGTVKELMTWIGDDVERAHQAVAAEYDDGKAPRKSLIRLLEEKFVTEVFQHPQFGGPDGKGGLGGSAVPEKFTLDAGAGDRTDTSNLELNKGGQDPTPASNVPAQFEADAGPGDAEKGAKVDGAQGGQDSTYGAGIPTKFVADSEPLDNEVDRPEPRKDHATAHEGEAAEDLTGPYKQFI